MTLQRPRPSILAVAGSLRAASINRAVLAAAARVAASVAMVHRTDAPRELPHYNADDDVEGASLPSAVCAWRDAVGTHDALLIACPEYAHGIPGTFKNALDWLVSSSAIVGKPVGLINTSPRASHAQMALREVLVTMSAHIVDDACVTIPLLGAGLDAAAMADDPAVRALLGQAVHALVGAARAPFTLGSD